MCILMGIQPIHSLGVENCPLAGFMNIFLRQHSHKQESHIAEVCQQALAPPEAGPFFRSFSRFLRQGFQTKVPPGDFLKLVVQGVECLHMHPEDSGTNDTKSMCHATGKLG